MAGDAGDFWIIEGAEQGDAQAFRLMQTQAMVVGQRRIELSMRITELEQGGDPKGTVSTTQNGALRSAGSRPPAAREGFRWERREALRS